MSSLRNRSLNAKLTVYNPLPFDASARWRTWRTAFSKARPRPCSIAARAKNRSGTFAAFLLAALGVPLATIREAHQSMANSGRARGRTGGGDAEAVEAGQVARPADLALPVGRGLRHLNVAFKVINQKFGSFDGYWREQLKPAPAELTALRQTMLED